MKQVKLTKKDSEKLLHDIKKKAKELLVLTTKAHNGYLSVTLLFEKGGLTVTETIYR